VTTKEPSQERKDGNQGTTTRVLIITKLKKKGHCSGGVPKERKEQSKKHQQVYLSKEVRERGGASTYFTQKENTFRPKEKYPCY